MKHIILKSVILAACATHFAACSTIIEGTSQKIAVSSTPVGASCDMIREGRSVANIAKTPSTVTVDKSKHDIEMKCSLAGYEPASQYLDSGIATGTFGNLILGGAIGWGIDSATGADNRYPDSVNMVMVPLKDVSTNISNTEKQTILPPAETESAAGS